MTTDTVRLDQEDEAMLRRVNDLTSLPISQILKRGVRCFQQRFSDGTAQTPYEIFRSLDLGPGGYAVASSTQPDALLGARSGRNSADDPCRRQRK